MEKTRVLKKRRTTAGVRWLTTCALLIAFYIVAEKFLSYNSTSMSIGFGVIAPMIAGMVFGPISGGIVYGLGDMISAILFPVGTFHPGYTITATTMGFLLGLFLHPTPINIRGCDNRFLSLDMQFSWKKVNIFNIIIPILFNGLVLGLFLNSYWTSQLYGSRTYIGWVLYRLPQYGIQLPVNILLATALLPVSKRLRNSFSK